MIGWAEDDPRRISTTILNPLGEDFSVMRTTVLPSMLESLAHNHAHRNPTASLYELGTIYTPVSYTHLLFKAAGRLGAHAERLGGHADGRAVEARGLEHNGLGVVLDLGVRAAHHARDRDRLVVVADGEHFVGQIVVLAVQGLDGLAVTRAAHDDLARCV